MAESSPIDGRWIGDSTDPPPVAPGARRGRYRLACTSAVHAEAAPVASPEHPRTSLNSRRTSSSIAPESALSIPRHGPCRHGSNRPHSEPCPRRVASVRRVANGPRATRKSRYDSSGFDHAWPKHWSKVDLAGYLYQRTGLAGADRSRKGTWKKEMLDQ